ncbi:hypothetical protein [Mycolicibacterium sphagni]|uniref:hypothetical protein n=1 Tax=Mycolicibacterium sphagni TaxID=1786 RepID=UPI0021F2E668|nr:hypothetical protein [Mycolicibacterium sphagni]MCV7174939.1 hypothetical protein [Mycolicibacterium sphagni]
MEETSAAGVLAPPEPAPEFDPVQAATPSHPYGDIEVYVYRPRNGAPAIVFPHIGTTRPTQKHFWKLYSLNPMFQSFEWMNFAKVPQHIQEQVMDLSPFEQGQFFAGWYAPLHQPDAGGMAPPGES